MKVEIEIPKGYVCGECLFLKLDLFQYNSYCKRHNYELLRAHAPNLTPEKCIPCLIETGVLKEVSRDETKGS